MLSFLRIIRRRLMNTYAKLVWYKYFPSSSKLKELPVQLCFSLRMMGHHIRNTFAKILLRAKDIFLRPSIEGRNPLRICLVICSRHLLKLHLMPLTIHMPHKEGDSFSTHFLWTNYSETNFPKKNSETKTGKKEHGQLRASFLDRARTGLKLGSSFPLFFNKKNNSFN